MTRRKMTDVRLMIPAPGWVATYDDADGQRVDPLVGWATLGAENARAKVVGLVLDVDDREVRRADDWDNFTGYRYEP